MRITSISVAALAVAAALLSGGCSHITMLRTKELREVREQVDSLNAQLSVAQQELLKRQKEHYELLRLIRADQEVRFSELDRKVTALEGNLMESQQQLSMIDRKTQDLKSRWEEKARADSLSKSVQEAEIAKLFQIAHDDFMARRYDLAISGFTDLKNQYSQSILAGEAMYWIAECMFAQQRYSEAEDAYKSYLREYAEGKMVCASLYKLGLVYEKNKKTKSKDMVWTKLKERCPDSEEARSMQAQSK